MAENSKPAEINVTDVVNYLNRAFGKAASVMYARGNKALRTITKKGKVETTKMYDYQVDFCYLIDNIQRSPRYIVPKYIQQANELIAALEAEIK